MRKSIKSNLPQSGIYTTTKADTKLNHVTGPGTPIKPVIASLAGTVRLVSMSKRPQPPAKPRSEQPCSAGGVSSSHTYSQQATSEITDAPSPQIPRSASLSRGNMLNPSSSHDRVDSENELESEQDGHAHKKARKKAGTHFGSTKELKASEKCISKNVKSSSATSTVSSLKSVTELLEEARNIAAGRAHDPDQQRAPQETHSEIMVRGSGPASGSGQTIKRIMDREKRQISRDVEEQVVETDLEKDMAEKSSYSPLQTMVLNQEEVFRTQTKEEVHEGPVYQFSVFSESCEIDKSVSQMDPKFNSEIPHGIISQVSLSQTVINDIDVLAALGSSFAPVQRRRRVFQNPKPIHSISLLATWTPRTGLGEVKSIHHFCTTPAGQVLPKELQLASRVCHAHDKLTAAPQFHQQRAAFRHMAALPDTHRVLCDGVPVEHAVDTKQTGGVIYIPAQPPDALADWQRIAEYHVEKPKMILCGHSATLCDGELRMFCSPAPPKFMCAPRVIKDKLFASYKAVPPDSSRKDLLAGLRTVTAANEQVEMKLSTSVVKILSKKHTSLMDLRAEGLPKPSPRISSKEQVRRPYSAPNLTLDCKYVLRLQSDFNTISRELEDVRQQQEFPLCAQAVSQLCASRDQPRDTHRKISPPKWSRWDPGHKASQHKRAKGTKIYGEGFIRRASASHLKLKTVRVRKRFSCAKLEYVYKKLNELPQTLTRSESLRMLPQCILPSASAKLTSVFRCKSLPVLLDSGRTCNEEKQENLPTQDEKNVKSMALSETLDEDVTRAELEKEVANLTQIMDKSGRVNAFDLCRRGALYKKLGCLIKALKDLNAAISLEPHLVDAYWHRHSIHLMRNNPSSALSDLSVIITHNQKHADAFTSRAEIYTTRGETSLAIIDYTESIRCETDNDEIYFRRARLYEKKSETLLAMEDYAKTFAINPARTDALMAHGLYHFNISSWTVALEDFSLLLKQEPKNARARTYRGRTFAKLGHFQMAIEDFSLAVHSNPNDWLALYHRGCLLRKIMPDMALRDLSISVLINNSSENLGAFLHRGLLYTECCQWQEAVADFEAVIKIDRTVAVAYMNLGIIYMQKLGQNYKAIKMFNKALKVNPTYIRAYICRSTAYQNVNDLERAVKDLTRAIHMRPDAQHLHIRRGQCLCDMGKFDSATLCMEYAAEISKALGSSVVQQAAVQSFLQNHAKAIDCLVAAADIIPSPPILILLGKTQMKANRFMEAVESFRKALSFFGPSETNFCNMPEASEVFYLTGMCYMAQGEDALLPQALDAFSSAVKLNSDHAEAYHQRGLCRMHLHHSNSVEDFNRSLYINPNFFQVYLSRAVFYGAQGRYSKAIFNCNEAIRIHPNSVRAYLYRGVLKFYMKGYKRAVEDLTMAIKIDSTCTFAYYNRGVCYHQMQEYELALRDYGILLLFPTQKEIHLKVLINRALVYVELGDYSSALQDFKAAAKQSEDASIYQALGICYHRLGKLQEAVEAYTEALRLNPFLLDAYVGRGYVFMDCDHAQANNQAQKEFLSALHLNPRCCSARVGLAYNLQVFGFFQRAWNQFTVALEVNPKCWAAYEGRAIVNLNMGNTFGAFQDINAALKINPGSDQLFTNRGVINQFMGDIAGAMRDYQKANSINPSCTLAFFNAANLFFYNRQYEQACEYYSRALDLDPRDESTILNRAITQALLQKIPESLQDFSKALFLNPQSAHVYFNRANLYISMQKHESAERDLTQALQLQPDDALLYKLRADVRGHLGLIELAIKDYKTALELQDTL